MKPTHATLIQSFAVLLLILGSVSAAADQNEWGTTSCAVPKLLSTSDWIAFEGQRFRLLTPAKFAPAIDQPFYVHGGHLLTDGDHVLEITYGAWGPESFGERGAQFCRMTVREQPVVVVRWATSPEAVQFAAIFPGSDPAFVSSDQPLISMVANDDATAALFYTIVSTASRLNHR